MYYRSVTPFLFQPPDCSRRAPGPSFAARSEVGPETLGADCLWVSVRHWCARSTLHIITSLLFMHLTFLLFFPPTYSTILSSSCTHMLGITELQSYSYGFRCETKAMFVCCQASGTTLIINKYIHKKINRFCEAILVILSTEAHHSPITPAGQCRNQPKG